MKVIKAKFNLYDENYKKNLNHFVELKEQGKIKIIKCYPVKNQIVIKYEEPY